LPNQFSSGAGPVLFAISILQPRKKASFNGNYFFNA